jgi:tetratricopeptide (TPR) repeat protein
LAHYREGHSQQAADLYQQALAQFREASDQAGQARALNSLGLVALQRRTYRGAREYFRAALTLCRTVGDRIGEVRALDYLRCAHTSTAVAHGPAVIFGRP